MNVINLKSEFRVSDKIIEPNSLVMMHYTLRLEDGSIADSTLDAGQPAILQIGAGHISQAFEQQLMGLTVHDKKRICLKPEDAYGLPIEENIYTVPTSRFGNISELEVGSIVAFTHPASEEEIPGIIRSVTEGLIIVDFNHPLAGHTVLFDVQIVDVDNEKSL